MEIREYRENDDEGISKLHEEFFLEFFSEFNFNYTEAEWELELHQIHSSKNKGKFWVIDENNEIIGLVGVILMGDSTAELKRMRVKSSYRGRGLGKKLLKTVEDYCKGLGITKIVLSTAERLTTARRMYERSGFELIEKREFSMPKFTICFYRKYL
ncbi:MAG: GNAT family N-acetyltransferase [Candidatus Hermodarchaeota archaeon]